MAPKHKYFLISLIASLGLDQGTKIWARNALKPILPDALTVIPGYWDFRYSENPGSAFGLFRSIPYARFFLFIIGIFALYVIWSYLKKAEPGARRLAAELGMVAGGAVGNIVDRVAIGRVTDFVVWKVGVHEWPTFNVADAALVVGVIGLLIDLKPPPKAEKPAKKKKSRA
jgi:signal peptidase II